MDLHSHENQLFLQLMFEFLRFIPLLKLTRHTDVWEIAGGGRPYIQKGREIIFRNQMERVKCSNFGLEMHRWNKRYFFDALMQIEF